MAGKLERTDLEAPYWKLGTQPSLFFDIGWDPEYGFFFSIQKEEQRTERTRQERGRRVLRTALVLHFFMNMTWLAIKYLLLCLSAC